MKELSLEEEQELLTTELKKLAMPQLNDNGKPYKSKIIAEKDLLFYSEDGSEIVRVEQWKVFD